MANRLGTVLVLPGGNVGEAFIVPEGFSLSGLVFFAEMGPTGFLSGQGIPQHELGEAKEVTQSQPLLQLDIGTHGRPRDSHFGPKGLLKLMNLLEPLL